MMLGQRRDLMAPARSTLGIAVQQQHRLALTGIETRTTHFVQISIKFAP
jgi:hypothetical protein